MLPSLEVKPIGVVQSPWKEKHSAPRQPAVARGVEGTIELFPHVHPEHSLLDLNVWSHLWVLFWFHQDVSFCAKVLPPRSHRKRGVLATRSPHRPNPLGLSVVRLLRVQGNILHISDVDMLDQTPVLDLKPYVPYTDSVADAGDGWLTQEAQGLRDPGPSYEVQWSARAQAQLAWLAARSPLPLQALAEEVLRLGPAPHAYRRIKARGDHSVLGVKDFRVRFVAQGLVLLVQEIASGYRPRVLADPNAQAKETTPLAVHRELMATFFPRSSS